MRAHERNEINQLPEKYRPIGAWGYFGYNILFSIPIIGFICLIAFACSSKNIVRRSYARSFFCVVALVVIAIVAIIVLAGGFSAILEIFEEVTSNFAN